MAGSYGHVTAGGDGKLLNNEQALQMLDCYHGDVYEALEEMYGMIWWLATRLEGEFNDSAAEFVDIARAKYLEGLKMSPGTDGRLPDDGG